MRAIHCLFGLTESFPMALPATADALLQQLEEAKQLVPIVKRRQTISDEGSYLKDLFTVSNAKPDRFARPDSARTLN